MAPRLLVLAPVLLLALIACGEAEEVTPTPGPEATATPPGESPTPGGDETITPSPDGGRTPSPGVPADWKTFEDPQHFGEASFRYPPDWHREENRVLSLGTAEWPSVCIPVDEMLIEASVTPAEKISRPETAVDFTHGPYAGWELFEDATDGCPGRAHTVAIERDGLVYTLILVTGPEVAVDKGDVFKAVVGSLRIAED